MIRHRWCFTAVLCVLTTLVCGEDLQRKTLEYAPAPVDNPLKGLVPYANPPKDLFPHSMEFNYLPLSAFVKGEKNYDWTTLEELLNGVAERGNQTIFRVFLEYPGKKDVIPKYLIDMGLKVHRYVNTNTQPFPPTEVETPEYSDVNLRACMRDFIAALGKKYDGDPRIGFITAGLLGTWGEWHDYPRDELWASNDVQIEVMDAYEAAFKVTPVLLRYPAGKGEWHKAANAQRPFGYHDDSFAWATVETGKPSDNWFFLAMMKRAGPEALNKWKTFPIGGEIRPEAWGLVFDRKVENPQIQEFEKCVNETHATWLMDCGLFNPKTWSKERRERAEELVRKMGYEFHVPTVSFSVKGKTIDTKVEILNRGVAPFYYDWPIEFALLDSDHKPLKTYPGKGSLKGLLSGEPARVWENSVTVDVAAGKYVLGLRVKNPLANGHALRFANKEQQGDWLELTTLEIPEK